MLFLQILLIPFKLIIKLLGFCLSGVVKLIGLTIITFSRFCGVVTNLVGGLLSLIGTIYFVCGLIGCLPVGTPDNWWLIGVGAMLLGTLISTMSLWVEVIGELINHFGSTIAWSASDLSLLP